MLNQLIGLLANSCKLAEQPIAGGQIIKKKGMTFELHSYPIEGIGLASTISMKGMLGLMRMESLIVNPTEVDMPLVSCDYVNAMGLETLILEGYDTQLAPVDLSAMEQVKAAYAALKDNEMKAHWYDPIKLPISSSKCDRKKTKEYNTYAAAWFAEYLKELVKAPACDVEAKTAKASVYVEGLLEHGGPSTDFFVGLYGKEKTATLYRRYLFGTERKKD